MYMYSWMPYSECQDCIMDSYIYIFFLNFPFESDVAVDLEEMELQEEGAEAFVPERDVAKTVFSKHTGIYIYIIYL